MKQIRYLAAGLLFITGFLHFLPLYLNFNGPNTLAMIFFGVGYFGISFLLYKNHALGTFLGILLPLVGLGAGFIKIGYQNWDFLLTTMFAIDVVVIVCCILLLNNRRFR